jgi:hypothetical protein
MPNGAQGATENRHGREGQGPGERQGDELARYAGADVLFPVTAQLVNDTNSTCFEAIYSAGDVVKNDARQFKAKH